MGCSLSGEGSPVVTRKSKRRIEDSDEENKEAHLRKRTRVGHTRGVEGLKELRQSVAVLVQGINCIDQKLDAIFHFFAIDEVDSDDDNDDDDGNNDGAEVERRYQLLKGLNSKKYQVPVQLPS